MVEQEPILLLMVCPSIDDQGFRRGERKIAARLVEHNILREHRQFEGRGGCDKDGDGCRLCECDERNDIELVVVFVHENIIRSPILTLAFVSVNLVLSSNVA